jgi:hypothetical protein
VDDFQIGDRLMFRGREYVLRGFSPMSAKTQQVQLEDVKTRERIWVPTNDFRVEAARVNGTVS